MYSDLLDRVCGQLEFAFIVDVCIQCNSIPVVNPDWEQYIYQLRNILTSGKATLENIMIVVDRKNIFISTVHQFY